MEAAPIFSFSDLNENCKLSVLDQLKCKDLVKFERVNKELSKLVARTLAAREDVGEELLRLHFNPAFDEVKFCNKLSAIKRIKFDYPHVTWRSQIPPLLQDDELPKAMAVRTKNIRSFGYVSHANIKTLVKYVEQLMQLGDPVLIEEVECGYEPDYDIIGSVIMENDSDDELCRTFDENVNIPEDIDEDSESDLEESDSENGDFPGASEIKEIQTNFKNKITILLKLCPKLKKFAFFVKPEDDEDEIDSLIALNFHSTIIEIAQKVQELILEGDAYSVFGLPFPKQLTTIKSESLISLKCIGETVLDCDMIQNLIQLAPNLKVLAINCSPISLPKLIALNDLEDLQIVFDCDEGMTHSLIKQLISKLLFKQGSKMKRIKFRFYDQEVIPQLTDLIVSKCCNLVELDIQKPDLELVRSLSQLKVLTILSLTINLKQLSPLIKDLDKLRQLTIIVEDNLEEFKLIEKYLEKTMKIREMLYPKLIVNLQLGELGNWLRRVFSKKRPHSKSSFE